MQQGFKLLKAADILHFLLDFLVLVPIVKAQALQRFTQFVHIGREMGILHRFIRLLHSAGFCRRSCGIDRNSFYFLLPEVHQHKTGDHIANLRHSLLVGIRINRDVFFR